MAVVKKVAVCAENESSMRRKEKDRSEGNRWVRPLYPLEPTTINKARLDKAVEDAIDKRLRSKR